MRNETDSLTLIIVSMLVAFSLVLWTQKIKDEKEIKESEALSCGYIEVE